MDMTDFLKPFLPWCVLQRTYIFAFLLSSRLFIRPHQLFAEVCQVRQAWITCSFSSLLHCDQMWYVCKNVKLEAVDAWFIIVPVFMLPYWIWQPNPTKDSQTFHNSDTAVQMHGFAQVNIKILNATHTDTYMNFCLNKAVCLFEQSSPFCLRTCSNRMSHGSSLDRKWTDQIVEGGEVCRNW